MVLFTSTLPIHISDEISVKLRVAFNLPAKKCPTKPKRMNFRKSSEQPLIPPLIFGKSYCRFFPELMTKVPFVMAKFCNINFWIGLDFQCPPPFGSFPKIHPSIRKDDDKNDQQKESNVIQKWSSVFFMDDSLQETCQSLIGEVCRRVNNKEGGGS